MIKYTLYQKNPSSHYIYIDLLIDNVAGPELALQLPAWRPGRYELGNFAKNIKRVDAFNEKNEPLFYTKTSKDRWLVQTNGALSVKVTYSYYAAELNAGSCFADISQVYVNPVHLCMFIEGRTSEAHQLEVKVPDHYKIASSLKQEGNLLTAVDFDELADSPFIASAQLQSDFYESNGIRFNIHLQGECRPDWKKIKSDFKAFTDLQVSFWKDFPYGEYHFLFQVLPQKFYHGVEHKKNTVIAIGPGYAFNNDKVYEEVLGVSCHELFHVWNIKTIRPLEMQPYDFTKENYARTGYVYEGFTTYFGDKNLLSSKVFSLKQYFGTLEERLQKHFHNFGRYNLSVAASSWETWLDGYVPGAPYRKTNIYDEGSLIAFMLDVNILKDTANKKSLRDVCVLLYERFGKTGKGYSESDMIALVNEVSGKDYLKFFQDHVYNTADYEFSLKPAFEYLGIQFTMQPASAACEQHFGFKILETGMQTKVGLVAPYSPSWKAGLFANDEIIAVNGMAVRNNLNHWLTYFLDSEEISLTVISGEQLRQMILKKDPKGNKYFSSPSLKMTEKPSESQKQAFESWQRF